MSRDQRAASDRTRAGVGQPADTAAGVALIAGSAVAYSSAGFFTRLIDVDLWTLICWRGLFSTLFLLAISYALHRRGTMTLFRSLDAAGWRAAGFSTAAMFCYLAALRNTTVADVAIIYGTAPFVTAAIALLLLGERSTRVTLLCSVLALPRRALPADRSAVLLASSLLAAPLAHIAKPSGLQIAELALFGISQLGIGLLLLTAGSRRLSASRVALIGALDVPLAPIWVWLAFGETPTTATIAGGLAVIAAVVLNMLLSNPGRQARPTAESVAPGTALE